MCDFVVTDQRQQALAASHPAIPCSSSNAASSPHRNCRRKRDSAVKLGDGKSAVKGSLFQRAKRSHTNVFRRVSTFITTNSCDNSWELSPDHGGEGGDTMDHPHRTARRCRPTHAFGGGAPNPYCARASPGPRFGCRGSDVCVAAVRMSGMTCPATYVRSRRQGGRTARRRNPPGAGGN